MQVQVEKAFGAIPEVRTVFSKIGTADVGLASAGYGARAQDASTVFTNPAGMTRLEGTQVLGSGQLDYGRTKFSIGSGTSPALGGNDGGNAFGSDGWFLGGGGFLSYSLSPTLKLGFAVTGNFGGVVDYDDNWGQLHVHLKKGPQLLDGDQTVGYARFRKDNTRVDMEGDVGRMRRQQQVIRALVRSLKDARILGKIPQLAEAVLFCERKD